MRIAQARKQILIRMRLISSIQLTKKKKVEMEKEEVGKKKEEEEEVKMKVEVEGMTMKAALHCFSLLLRVPRMLDLQRALPEALQLL